MKSRSLLYVVLALLLPILLCFSCIDSVSYPSDSSDDADVNTPPISDGGTTDDDSLPRDNEPPSVPTNLALNVISSERIDLTWSASSDDVGVQGYNIYQNDNQRSTSSVTYFSDTGLMSDTPYCYSVTAYDEAGNESGLSNRICENTLADVPLPAKFCIAVGAPGGEITCDYDPQISVLEGESKSFRFDLLEIEPTGEEVSLTVDDSAAPVGADAMFDVGTLSVNDHSTFTVTANSFVEPGEAKFTLIGNGPSGTFSRDIYVTVAPADSFFADDAKPIDVEIESGGTTALVADCLGGPRLMRVSLSDMRASQTIVSGIGRRGDGFCLTSLEIESGGLTALVGWGRNYFFTGGESKMLRVELATGELETVASGFNSLIDIEVEDGGTSAIVIDEDWSQSNQRIFRVYLGDGTQGGTIANLRATDLAIESGGETAIVTDGSNTYLRLNLGTDAQTILTNLGSGSDGQHLILEPGGEYAITSGLARVNLTTGERTNLAGSGFGGGVWNGAALDLEADGNIIRLAPPRIERVILVSSPTVVASPGGSGALAVTGDGAFAYVVNQANIYKINLSTGATFGTVNLDGSYYFSRLALLPGETAALGLANGALVNIDLATGAISEVLNSVLCLKAVAVESSGNTALVVDDNLSRLIRVDLTATNTFIPIANNIVDSDVGCNGMPSSLQIESGGATALVSGDGPVYRIDLATFAKEIIYAGPAGSKIAIMPGGKLLTADAVSLLVIDLTTGERTRLGLASMYMDFALEPGGTTALISSSSSDLLRLTLP
jgi:hypothetical protein